MYAVSEEQSVERLNTDLGSHKLGEQQSQDSHSDSLTKIPALNHWSPDVLECTPSKKDKTQASF